MGKERRIEVSGTDISGRIGYLSVRFKREMTEKVLVGVDWDSDFNSDDRHSKARLALSY